MIQTMTNYAGAFLALLSIGATAYFARRYSEKKLPRFSSTTETRIATSKDAPDGISVSYKGQAVKRISSTLVWFWNAGRRPLKREDLPATQPLEIQLEDGDESREILDVVVRRVSRQAIGFAASKCGPSGVTVTFDFMDQNDGAAIEILHTGSVHTEAGFSGIILGAPKGLKRIRGRDLPRMFLLSYPRSTYAHHAPPLRVRVVASILITAVLAGLAGFLLALRGDITTTQDLLSAHLGPFMADQQLDAAVSAVVLNSKYRTANAVSFYILNGILVANLVVCYLVMWRSPFPFPSSLALNDAADGKHGRVDDTKDGAETN